MVEAGDGRFVVYVLLQVVSSSKASHSHSKLTPSSCSNTTRGSAFKDIIDLELYNPIVTYEECCWGGRQSGAERQAPSVRSRPRSATHFGPHGQG